MILQQINFWNLGIILHKGVSGAYLYVHVYVCVYGVFVCVLWVGMHMHTPRGRCVHDRKEFLCIAL